MFCDKKYRARTVHGRSVRSLGGVIIPPADDVVDEEQNGGTPAPPPAFSPPTPFEKPSLGDIFDGTQLLKYKVFPARILVPEYVLDRADDDRVRYRCVCNYGMEFDRDENEVQAFHYVTAPFWYDPALPDEYLYMSFSVCTYRKGDPMPIRMLNWKQDGIDSRFVENDFNGLDDGNIVGPSLFSINHTSHTTGADYTYQVHAWPTPNPCVWYFHCRIDRDQLTPGLNAVPLSINCSPTSSCFAIRHFHTWLPDELTFAEKLPEFKFGTVAAPNVKFAPVQRTFESPKNLVEDLMSNQTTDYPTKGSGVWSSDLGAEEAVVFPWEPDNTLNATVVWPVSVGFRGDGNVRQSSDITAPVGVAGPEYQYTIDFGIIKDHWVCGNFLPNAATKGIFISKQGGAGIGITSLIHLCRKSWLNQQNTPAGRATPWGSSEFPQFDLEGYFGSQYAGGHLYRDDVATNYQQFGVYSPAVRLTPSGNPDDAGVWTTVN